MADRNFVRIPGFQADSLSLSTLEGIVNLLKTHEINEVKFTGKHQISLPGVGQPTVQALSEGLQQLIPKDKESTAHAPPALTTIRTCPDTVNCKHGIRDINPITDRLNAIALPGKLPAKVKVSVAGCKMCCTAPFIRDIGLIAEQKGWKLIFGGNGGSRPRIGDVIAAGLSDEQAIELILRCLIVYVENAKPKMRTARFMESYGAMRFKSEVLAMS